MAPIPRQQIDADINLVSGLRRRHANGFFAQLKTSESQQEFGLDGRMVNLTNVISVSAGCRELPHLMCWAGALSAGPTLKIGMCAPITAPPPKPANMATRREARGRGGPHGPGGCSASRSNCIMMDQNQSRIVLEACSNALARAVRNIVAFLGSIRVDPGPCEGARRHEALAKR